MIKNYLFILLLFIVCSSKAQISDFKDINFTRADNTAKLHEGENLKSLPLLSYKLTHKLPTEVEKFRAIYTWVCANIKGDNNQHSKVARNREKFKNDSLGHIEWNNQYKKKAFKKLLKRKKTMCTGYAYLIKELSLLAGIECKIIDGYGRTVTSNIHSLETTNHSWNAVKLNNKWYLCDATWSSGYMDENGLFIQNYNDGYFLTEPILFARNHYPINKKWLLCDEQTDKKFVSAPLLYGEAFKHQIMPNLPSTMEFEVKKNEETEFKITSLKNIDADDVALIFLLDTLEKRFKIFDVKNENGLISFKYKFKWTGYFDIHLKIKNDIVATYGVNVIDN